MPRWRNAAPPQNGVQPRGVAYTRFERVRGRFGHDCRPTGRSRAPASDSRFMRQGSLVPAAAGCWGHDGCRQGLGRHDRLHCLPEATLCSSTGRYAVSGAKGTPVTVEGRPARPAHRAPRSSLPCPRILARGRRSRFPGHAARPARGGSKDGGTLTVGPASDGGTERQRRVPLPVASSPGMTVKRIAGLASPGEFFPGRGIPGRRRRR